MMPLDLTGQVFGRLTVLERAPATGKDTHSRWLCRCVCGNTTTAISSNLRRGTVRSCKCLSIEIRRAQLTTHGRSKSREFRSWASMRQRCRDVNSPDYPNYGGRGIRICDRWDAFANFLADMGERPPGTSIDRINVNLGYSPDNCRWATASQQQLNKRFHQTRGGES